MLEIKRLRECKLDDVISAWNSGFEGYSFNMTMTIDHFITRLSNEGLSADLSVVGFMNGQPAGIILSGIRMIQGKKVAWNGGTGVATAFRRQGVGKALMKEVLDIYKEEGVQLATLEAISENAKAIDLYKDCGFTVMDHLEYLELSGPKTPPLSNQKNTDYTSKRVALQKLDQLAFYKHMNPWQTHWKNAKGSQAIIVLDSNLQEVGYANYNYGYSEDGKHVATYLYQCEANPEREDQESILHYIIHEVFGTCSDDTRRVILNLPSESSKVTHNVLKNLGFSPTIKQVYMTKEM
ncbi:GNAT family N-acetyltransferase [Bacillus salitolerans]|uniref:GNAT family N-acetyltransferase n=1 Tax=Bacillus salitolerans TaxID=1437434 RepID=A0ABW4LWV4_9BACI